MSVFYTNVEKYGNKIYWRGYENGKAFFRKEVFSPTLFVPSENGDWRSFIDNVPVAPKKFDTMKDAKEFLERYSDVGNYNIYGTTSFAWQFIQERFPDDITFDSNKINIFAFDIEVDISTGYPDIDKADKPLTSIAAKSSKRSTHFLFGLKDYDKQITETGVDPDDILYLKCESEEDLILKFLKIWKYEYPEIVTGWNVELFDVRYLINRIKRIFGESKANELSPWGRIRDRIVPDHGKKIDSYEISGMTIVDYMEAFKKFGYKYGTLESYKLDHVSYIVLGEKKLSYDEYGNLTNLYNENPQKYLDYNLKDTALIERLENQTALIQLVMTLAYKSGTNYRDAFGTTGKWESTIYRKLMEKKLAPPIKKEPGEKADLLGGHVKEPVPDMYDWIVTFDLASLYPHLMLQYNMSPETYLPDVVENTSQEMILEGRYVNKDKSKSVAANGVCFTNEKLGLIPEIIEQYYNERKEVKRKMLDKESKIEKIKEEIKRRSKNVG